MSLSDFTNAVAAELAVEPDNIAHIELEAFFVGGIDPHDTAQHIIANGG